VTDMNNMLNLTTTRPQTAPTPSANGQKAPTLSDFVGLLLSPEGQTQDTAALQNMPQNLKALAEKIAAALNGDAPVPAAPAAGDAAAAADENAKTALLPEQRLDQAVHIILIGAGHLRRAVDQGIIDSDLLIASLDGNSQRFPRCP